MTSQGQTVVKEFIEKYRKFKDGRIFLLSGSEYERPAKTAYEKDMTNRLQKLINESIKKNNVKAEILNDFAYPMDWCKTVIIPDMIISIDEGDITILVDVVRSLEQSNLHLALETMEFLGPNSEYWALELDQEKSTITQIDCNSKIKRVQNFRGIIKSFQDERIGFNFDELFKRYEYQDEII